MRLILPVLVLALAALASPGQTEPEWLGIRTDLERLSHQSAAAEPFAGSSQPDLSQDLDMRAFCGMGDEAFIAQLISQDCGDDGCAGRPAMVKRTIETLAAELDGLMTDARAGGELLFVPADSVFPRRPPESGEEVMYRAAADLWLRNSTDASTGDPSQRRRSRLLHSVKRLPERRHLARPAASRSHCVHRSALRDELSSLIGPPYGS